MKPIAALKVGRVRSHNWHCIWHDTADLRLARDGLCVAQGPGGGPAGWRLEALFPAGDSRTPESSMARASRIAFWPPGAPPPVLAAAADPVGLDLSALTPLRPAAACTGRLRMLTLSVEGIPVTLSVLEARIGTLARQVPCARLWLEGDDAACLAVALELAAHAPVALPVASLAATALGLAPRPRRLGAPDMPADLSPAAAFAHALGHLGDVAQHWGGVIAAGSPVMADTEPVHQMRVALRRLRACLSAFRHATDTPAVRALGDDARHLSGLLGPARDWDVFVAETGAAVATAVGDDPAVGRLLVRAERRRRAAYAALRAFLDSAAFRCMGIRLACLAGGAGWRDALAPEQQAALASDIRAFAGKVMDRRLKRVRRAGDRINGLDTAALHVIRLDGKRLRYAAEIFAPLFERKKVARFQRRLTALQERLGTLNDGAVTAGLMAELLGSGRAGGERAYGAGIVRGFVAARGIAARSDIERAWERFGRAKPFW